MTKTQTKQLKKMNTALKYFTENIKGGPMKKDVLKIILFGSLLDKKIHRGSDIDLAIISKNPEKIEKKIDDLSYEAVLRYGELIEPIVYSLRQYKNPRSAFLMKILRDGKEIYSRK